VAGLGAYRRVLADRSSRAFTLAGLFARLPLSMTGLGIVLLISITTGSFGRAGLVTAVGTLVGAIAAPAWGRVIDRVGQARVLITATVINNLGLAVLIISVLQDWPLATTLLAAAVVGLGFSSAGACVRARWTYRLRGTALLNTAFAWEAIIDEVVFIVGPVLATFLATSIHPALGLATGAVLGLIGALALAAQRSSEPPVDSQSARRATGERLSVRVLIPIVVAYAALGVLFGGMEVVIVAFAEEAGLLPLAGLLVMAWASGSLVAGLVTGAITWRASPLRRFRIGAALLAASLLPLPFMSHPALIAFFLIVSGLGIAPTLIASTAVTSAAVPTSRLTEALGWTSTGLASGLALGAAAYGQVIDLAGARAGFWAGVVTGGLLIISALCVRAGRLSPAEEGTGPDSEPATARPAPAENPLR
jgi:MFS family permease